MGCDGGTIPKRDELVRTAKRPVQKDQDMFRQAKWTTCTIGQQSLSPPIMACELGKLYSKEAVLEFLLDRSISDAATHIRNLKDVKTLKLTPNPGYEKSSQLANQYADNQKAKYICPIVGIEMNGKYKFALLWTCGCVLSERALKEAESEACHNCSMKFTKEDIIVLNPEGEDIETMQNNMQKRREKVKALRKEKKEKKLGDKRTADQATISTNEFKEPAQIINNETNLKTSEKTKISSKDRKAKDKIPAKKAKKSVTTTEKKVGLIDPKASEVYKNLFTSSRDSKEHNSAHWITYNPYHL